MKSRWIGFVFVLIFAVLFAIRQYRVGTWLVGWDSLHPEFNYQLAFERVFSGVWRESQGVGVVAVHSHVAELPRIAVLWLIDLFVVTSAVRWIYVLLMLFLGIVGAYVLLVHILSRMRGKLAMGWITAISVVGSLAYLFNLSTLHHFLVPFEMFVALFGLLPWSIWSVVRYLEIPNKKRLWIFVGIQILLAPIAFAATLWAVYFGVLALSTFTLARSKRQWIKVLLITLSVNAYWLLPTIYGVVINGSAVAASKINLLFSPEAWLNNVAYGTIPQVLRLESFLLSWMSWDRGRHVFDLLTQIKLNIVLSSSVLIVVLAGMVRWFLMAVRNGNEARKWAGWNVMILFLILIMLSNTWPMSLDIEWARERLPLVGEILRTPFTKVSIFLQLGYVIFVGTFLAWILGKVKANFLRAIILASTSCLIVYPFSSWITKGDLIGGVVINKLPAGYEQLFAESKKWNDGRMVALPAQTMWGWEYRDWGSGNGYEGANFTQFGIKQPLLIRDFDRWSPYNETFYNQLSTAMYECKIIRSVSDSAGLPTKSDPECASDVARVLSQYDVRYVLLDESVIAPGQDNKILRIEETKKIAEELGWVEKFHEGFLTVWEIPSRSDLIGVPTRSDLGYVSAPATYTLAEGDTAYGRVDPIYKEWGSYVTVAQKQSDIVSQVQYPFASLMREEIKNVEYQGDSLRLSVDVGDVVAGAEVKVPGIVKGETIKVTYTPRISDGSLYIDFAPLYQINGQRGAKLPTLQYPLKDEKSLWIKLGENEAIYVEEGGRSEAAGTLQVGEKLAVKIYSGNGDEIDQLENIFVPDKVQNCWNDGASEQVASGEMVEDYLRLTIKDAAACIAIPLVKSTRDELLQVIVNHKSEELMRPELCLDEEVQPYRCDNLKVWEAVDGSREWQSLSRTVSVARGERYWLDISAKGVAPHSRIRTIDYKLPRVVRYRQIKEYAQGDDFWAYIEHPMSYTLGGGKIDVEIVGKPETYDLATFGKEKLENCDVLSRGVANKFVAQGAVYTADSRGVACDYVPMPRSSTQMANILHIVGETTEGRPPKIFVWNTGSERNSLEYLLGKGRFDQSFVLLPGKDLGSYVLNIEARSFGQKVSNRFDRIESYYLPMQLSQLSIKSSRSDLAGVPTRSDLEIKKVEKFGTWLYRLRVSGGGLMRLSQGFDKGWVGVAVSGATVSQLEHVKVDGWANGFVLSQNGSRDVIIFYWPQLLEYLGFVILAGVVAILIFSKKQN